MWMDVLRPETIPEFLRAAQGVELTSMEYEDGPCSRWDDTGEVTFSRRMILTLTRPDGTLLRMTLEDLSELTLGAPSSAPIVDFGEKICITLDTLRARAGRVSWALTPRGLSDDLNDLTSCRDRDTVAHAVETLSETIRNCPALLHIVLAQDTDFGKAVWEAQAQVAAAQSDEVLEHYAPLLLDWLQDLNWPGSMCLFERMARMRPGRIDDAIAECIQFAQTLGDDEWIMFLRELQNARWKDNIS